MNTILRDNISDGVLGIQTLMIDREEDIDLDDREAVE
jgi:hypothetical protein